LAFHCIAVTFFQICISMVLGASEAQEAGALGQDCSSTGKASHLLLRVAYNGQSFFGFQRQAQGPTVQAFMEDRLSKFFNRPCILRFGSRTDSGVHALDQCVVMWEAESWLKGRSKLRALIPSFNSLFKGQIIVWDLTWLAPEFSFKEDVLWKSYTYRIFNSALPDPTAERSAYWVKPPLDLDKMSLELRSFIGEHDFSAFAKSSAKAMVNTKKGAVRKILDAKLLTHRHDRWPRSQWIELHLKGSGFLHHMVRNMVGTLVDIGLGKNIDIGKTLRTKDRGQAGRSAPAQALTLRETKLRAARIKPLEG